MRGPSHKATTAPTAERVQVTVMNEALVIRLPCICGPIDEFMKVSLLRRFFANEEVNFLLTNRIPRVAVTRFMGWFSKLEIPWLTRLSIAVWRLFTDLDLSDARPVRYRSLHDCFTRELIDGARPVDLRESVLCSPCDAIVGAHGRIHEGQVLQIKGLPYALRDLVGTNEPLAALEQGQFITLRLTSAMYHRFHAPCDLHVEHLTYISGDVWNVNPAAVKRISGLYCRNERAVVRSRVLGSNSNTAPMLIVPVAAILVASMRFRFADVLMHLRYRGAHLLRCDARLRKGEEMGWFEHGSTIILLVPPGYRLDETITEGARVRMGQAMLHRMAA